MTTVTLSYGKNGMVRKCQANGHAGFSRKGSDIVCSAVTILLRTAMNVLSHIETVCMTADTSSRGAIAFSVEVKTESPETEAELRCIADFISTGIASLADEYPRNVVLVRECTFAEE